MIRMIWPTPGFYRVTSGFRPPKRPAHDGIDIGRNLSPPQAIDGADIVAVADGRVVHSHYSRSAGNMIVIDHGSGVETGYFHNSVNLARAGQQVRRGEVIARVGNTGDSFGAHLHFYVRINGQFVDPLDYLSKGDEEVRFQTVDEMPDWAQPEIQELIDRGFLAGSGEGLDLSMDMIRLLIINRRMVKAGG